MPSHVFPATALSLAGLLLSLPASSAGVFIILDEFGSTLSDPVFVSSSGANYQAEVDLQSGTIKALVSASAPPSTGFSFDGRSLVAGIEPVVLTNLTGSAILAQSQFLSLLVDGTYSFGFGTTGDRGAGVFTDASLSAAHFSALSGTTQIYEAGISVANYWADDPNRPFGFRADPTGLSEENGATVNVILNDETGLQALLLMPAVTLEANDTLTVSLQIFTGANATNGTSATNDFFNTAQLSLQLPPGTFLSSNAATSLDWVTTVPLPSGIWLLATGVIGLKWFTKRRRAVAA